MKQDRHILATMTAALLTFSATAQTLSIAPVEAETGGKTELVVRESAMAGFTALQFNLMLPEGLTLDEENITKGSGASGHELAIRTLADGSHLFVLYNMYNALLAKGELLRLPVSVGSVAGTREGSLTKVRAATTDAVSHAGSDAVFTVTVKAEELPVTITADDQTMTYGDDVPTLTFKSEGATLNGTPTLTTTATKTSPVGTYPIKVEKGTVTNEQVTCVDGTLTIGKATLTVGVENVTITQDDAIPTFTLTYSGWRNNDTEANAFTTKPTATTSATTTSAPGTYPITISGGDAQNYVLSYTSGTLTIEQATGIYTINQDASTAAELIYDFTGQRLARPQRGLNLIGGKKVFVKE